MCGVGTLTFQTRPTMRIPRITRPPTLRCQGLSPRKGDVANAWWLRCQDSPNEIHDSNQTLRDSSWTRNRRAPTKWQTELTDHVMWWSRKIRIRPPQNIACRPAPNVPPQIQPAANGASSETATQSGNIREMKTMPR